MTLIPHRYDLAAHEAAHPIDDEDRSELINLWIDRHFCTRRWGAPDTARDEWRACPVRPGQPQLAPLRYDWILQSAGADNAFACRKLRWQWRDRAPDAAARAAAEWLRNPVRPGDAPLPESEVRR